jgi:hypothetical protein
MADELNPGIVKMVELINSMGFRTTDSGDGETHDHECDRDVGYVVVVLRADQKLHESADTIARKLMERGVKLATPGSAEGTLIHSSYSPNDGVRLVDIHNVHDRMLK